MDSLYTSFTSYTITDRSFVAYTKREIHQECLKARFSEKQQGEIDIIVTELCTNLIKHANGGDLLARVTTVSSECDCLELISIDHGPGFDDAQKMMRDGFSTSLTLGHGLGSISRLSDQFQILSQLGGGAVMYCVKYSRPPADLSKRKIDVKVLCVPKTGEMVCGDGYDIKTSGTSIQILFGDGLGHGEAAHDAINEAIRVFRNTSELDPSKMLRVLHEGVRKTRGLVCTIATLDLSNSSWSICGVGNIMTRLYNGIAYKNFMSYNGVIGLNIPRALNNSVVPSEKNQRLIMCSDGIRSGWDLSKFPSILRYDNAVIAAAIQKDYTRKTDDTSSLVASLS